MEALEELGAQRLHRTDGSQEYHRSDWARVTLADQLLPRVESTLRHLVTPADFLDTLQ